MGKLLGITLLLGVLAVLLSRSNGDRTNKKIYININGYAMCFRRMNATHQIGCNSKRGGNVGVVHYIQDDGDINWVITKGTHAPYTALVTPNMFREEHVRKMLDSGKFSGMMVAYGNGTERPEQFSPDDSCPNDRLSLYKGDEEYGGCQATMWNPAGNGFLYQDFDIPIVALTNDTEIDIIIKQCFEKFNKPGVDHEPRDFPLCSAQLKDEMDAAKDTPTCLRRSGLVQGLTTENYCDALGDHNVFALTRPITFLNSTGNDSVIIASTRMDGSSLFDGLYSNADSAASGIVTLLAAAQAISAVKDTLPPDHKPIMFAFFQGETYDYIGSSRMIYDMEKNQFPTEQQQLGEDKKDAVAPITLHNIHSVLEVSQVGRPQEPGKMWIQTDPLSPDNIKAKVDDMVKSLKAVGADSGLTLSSPPSTQPLPPASLQSFLKRRGIPGLVITDHEKEFTNKYYNSRFDLPGTIKADYPPGIPENETYDYVTEAAVHLEKVATTLARTLYKMSTGKDPSHITVDNTTVPNLLNCYLHDASCELFEYVKPKKLKLGKKPLTFYVGVSHLYSQTVSNLTAFTRRTLAFYLGDKVVNATEDSCKNKEQDDYTQTYTWMAGPLLPNGHNLGVCYKSTANFSLAKSPAFDIPDYDWSSSQYSSWSESQWQTDAMEVRIFLVPSKEREIAILLGGLGFALLSTGAVYFIKRRARSLFTVAP